MASAHDVAKYILKKRGPMTAMKLQKLVYYCQAWSLVWDDRPMFPERIEAWANGPVVPDLYYRHRGKYMVSGWQGSIKNLDQDARDTIDQILDFYGSETSQWLSDLTHAEDPWANARSGLPVGARSDKEITHADMAEYYSSL